NCRNVERKIGGQLERLNFCLLKFSGNVQLLPFCLRGQIDARWFEFRQIQTAQIAHLHVEPRVQVGQRSVRIQFDIQQTRGRRFESDVLKKFSDVEVCRLKHRLHFSVRRKQGLVCSEIFPDEGDRNVAGGVLRLALIDLDLRNLERFAL